MVTKCPLVYERPRGIQTTMLAALFYVGTFVPVCARVHGVFWRECPGTPRVKRHKKSRIFSSRGAKSFLWPAFLSGNSFFVRGFVRLRGRGRGFSLWWCSIMEQGGKAASPASASPWRTPTNRSRTRLFSAPNSPAFRGSQQPLMPFPLEEPGAIFPHPAVRIDKEKEPWYNVHDPTWVALVSCLLAGARAFFMPPSCAWTHDAGRALGRPETCGPEDFMSRNPPC